MTFRPILDRIAVRRVEPEAVTKGGIIIPDVAKVTLAEGVVVAIGPGTRDDEGKLWPLELVAGDRVLFSPHAGHEVKIDGEPLLIMVEKDCMGVLARCCPN